jgi:transposase
MSVERVREGEVPSAVIASYGFCRTTIYRWLRTAKGRGRGLAALRSRKGTGRPRKLTAAQGRQVFRWINGKDPRQYGFDFGLWTRQVVAELVADRFRVKLSLASVGKLLAALGLTAQKPLMRAYERDPAAIDAWKRDTYPSIAARAKRLGAEIYFWDESGFRADAVQGRTWGVRGSDADCCGARQATVGLGSFHRQCQRRLLVCDIQGRNERRFVCRNAQADHAPSPQTIVPGYRQSARPQGKTRARLCRGDRWQPEIVLPARLCAGIEPGRTGMEPHEAHRNR